MIQQLFELIATQTGGKTFRGKFERTGVVLVPHERVTDPESLASILPGIGHHRDLVMAEKANNWKYRFRSRT